jgi:branched-chain amino acid transport system ATP-binding protein
MLKADSINFYYGEVQVLRDVTVEVRDREFVAIFGPNGHGKSTLLKVICGLLTPSSGSVQYNGETITGRPIHQIVDRGVVYIPEDRHLFPEMTVLENLEMGAYPKHARAKKDENLEYVFHLFPRLKILREQMASTLSGGEGRMLAIGRGLMSDPSFMAIDEPSFGLAPNLTAEVFNAINEIREKKGVSILLVEQSTSIAARFADRVYVLEDGRIVFEGTPDNAVSNEHIRKAFLGV